MKLLLAQHSDQQSRERFVPGNEVLRLAAEMLEGNGSWPTIDVHNARLSHWNGRKISIARSELADLIDRGLLAYNGGWTEYGRRELARQAGMEAPVALVRQRPYATLSR